MTEQAAISEAGRWLADNWETIEHPLLRAVRDKFGLALQDAVKALAMARRIRAGGAS